MLQMATKCLATNCKQTFMINSSNVTKEQFMGENGQLIWLTYCECPNCGKRYFLQVDTPYTNTLLRIITKAMGRLMAKRQMAQKLDSREERKFNNKRNKLANIRQELKKQWSGRKVCTVTGKQYVVEFLEVQEDIVHGK